MSGHGTLEFGRRRLLAAAGSVVLAGCGRFEGPVSDRQSTELDGTALRALGAADRPDVPETIPVEIDRAYLERTETRARTLLASVPSPLGLDEIPNGAIREELTGRRERAKEAIRNADAAASPFEAMGELRRARSEARALVAGWRAIDEGLTQDAVAERAPAVRNALDEFRDRWAYVGESKLRAVLVHEAIEHLTYRAHDYATIDTDRFQREQETPVSVGDLAGRLEQARASVDDAGHVFSQFQRSLDSPRDLRPVLDEAAAALVSTVERRHGELPPRDSITPSEADGDDVEETPAGWTLSVLYDDAASLYWIDENQSAGRPAMVIVAAHETLAEIKAFESLREKVANGETYAVETVDDVRAIRSEAVNAVETAMAETRHPQLTRTVLTELSFDLRTADQELREVRDEIEAEYLGHDLSFYVKAAAIARHVPAVTDRVVSTL